MNVFISYSQRDKTYAELIANRLREANHQVWYDAWTLKVGDNLIDKINKGLKEAEVLIVIISKHSLRSKWAMHEFSALAFGDISGRKIRIIPVLIDNSAVPEYLARYVYVDLTVDKETGLQNIISALAEPPKPREKPKAERKRTYDKAIEALSQELHAGRLSLVCGAGVSIGAGIPLWNSLLLKLLESMMVKISEDHSIFLSNSDANEFQKRYGPSALVLGKYLKTNLGNDFLPQLRDALYSDNPTTCDIIDAIVELSRPQRDGKPIDSILTFNFDGMIEENLEKHSIRHKAIFTEGMRNAPNELPVYHVHGYLPRKGRIKKDAEIVFSEDAYHSQFTEPFSWSNLIQLNKLNQNTCLFVGLSLTDPNLRRLLDVSNRKNPSRILSHYIIKKVPNLVSSSDKVDDLAFLLEEQDANELGLNVVWIQEFNEIAQLLQKVRENQA
jgi:hypothetical protein